MPINGAILNALLIYTTLIARIEKHWICALTIIFNVRLNDMIMDVYLIDKILN